MTLAVRPLALIEPPRLGGVSSGQVIGYEPRALTFDLRWDRAVIEHRLPIREQGGISAYHTDPEGIRTGSVEWRLTEGRAARGGGWVYTYVDFDGRDFCIISFGVPTLEGVVVYAEDDLAEIVGKLELVPLVELVGSDELPLP
jgi:hypothetical protein